VEEPLEGIAAADARLGRPFPLPAAALPLARWVEVSTAGPGAEVAWNLDDSRLGSAGRLAIYAGPSPPPARALFDAAATDRLELGGCSITRRRAPLDEAEPSLRPVQELTWSAEGLHLRLTAQGPWDDAALLEIVASMIQ